MERNIDTGCVVQLTSDISISRMISYMVLRIVDRLADNQAFTVFAALASIISFLWLIYDRVNGVISIYPYLAMSVAFLAWMLMVVYAFLTRSENLALKSVAKKFRVINGYYKESLDKVFRLERNNSLVSSEKVTLERDTLYQVVRSIESIYRQLIKRECVVTIKLLTKEEEILYATTYLRSSDTDRERLGSSNKYLVNAAKNTAFDKVYNWTSAGVFPHFHSYNLGKESDYENERPGYKKLYRNVLVVPISNGFSIQEGRLTSCFGFLTVDTKSTNRINNGHHLEMLIALSEQMYNFMLLLRGSTLCPDVQSQKHTYSPSTTQTTGNNIS